METGAAGMRIGQLQFREAVLGRKGRSAGDEHTSKVKRSPRNGLTNFKVSLRRSHVPRWSRRTGSSTRRPLHLGVTEAGDKLTEGYIRRRLQPTPPLRHRGYYPHHRQDPVEIPVACHILSASISHRGPNVICERARALGTNVIEMYAGQNKLKRLRIATTVAVMGCIVNETPAGAGLRCEAGGRTTSSPRARPSHKEFCQKSLAPSSR